MSVSVLVPTYRRPRDLERCLQCLTRQTRPADEVVIVARADDADTWSVLRDPRWAALPLRPASVERPGVVAALNAGLAVCRSDIVAITDDDGAPHADWLARIDSHFAQNKALGGLGGRDIVQSGPKVAGDAATIVGKLQWFGRRIGNHDRGAGPARPVDILKGVNMSFRRAALGSLRFDDRLRGTGAQVHNEIGVALAVQRAGWLLLYDPAVLVDHYHAARHDEDQRHRFNPTAVSNAVHNETLLLLEHVSPARRWVFLVWTLFFGTRDAFGLMQFARFAATDVRYAWAMLKASQRGRRDGRRTWRDTQGQPRPAAGRPPQ